MWIFQQLIGVSSPKSPLTGRGGSWQVLGTLMNAGKGRRRQREGEGSGKFHGEVASARLSQGLVQPAYRDNSSWRARVPLGERDGPPPESEIHPQAPGSLHQPSPHERTGAAGTGLCFTPSEAELGSQLHYSIILQLKYCGTVLGEKSHRGPNSPRNVSWKNKLVSGSAC